MIISVDVEKSFGKNLAGFHDKKNSQKIWTRGRISEHVKVYL